MKLILSFLLFGVATLTRIEACQDARLDCHFMKAYCPWKSYETFMRQNCPRTCNFCGGGGSVTTNQPPEPPTNVPPAGGCGNPEIQHTRVIAGKTAIRGSWPWQVLMLYNGRAGCGGSLVSPYWIVTAAHCVSGKERNTGSFTIRVGEHNRNSREDSEVNLPVSKVIAHHSYNKRTLDNDIAMIKLRRPAQFNKYVSPICLPNGDAAVGTECYITGWGKTRHPGSMTSVLQQGKFPIVSSRVCENLNRKTIPVPITSGMICAGHGGSTRISGCHGDSGGPFVCRNGDKWVLHGAVSHGSGDCSAQKTYTVFARVNYFRSWIQQQMAMY